MPQATTPAPAKQRENRSTLALSDRTAKELDQLSERAERKTREVLGYGVKPTRTQLVAELVAQAATRRDEQAG